MARTVGIGNQDFETVREKEYFYIDKTHFIRQWWESGDHVTLITRPRRFGKTLNMSMLEKFFSVKYAGRSDLFEGLSIWNEEKYRQLQGTYPVLFISFADVKETSYPQTRKRSVASSGSSMTGIAFFWTGTYWANTSSNSLVGKLIRQGSRQVKETFERLLSGESIRTEIDEQIV